MTEGRGGGLAITSEVERAVVLPVGLESSSKLTRLLWADFERPKRLDEIVGAGLAGDVEEDVSRLDDLGCGYNRER